MAAKIAPGRIRAPGAGRPVQSNAKFDTDTFQALANDLKTGRLPLGQVTVTDPIVKGLRCIVRSTGAISFHINFDAGRGQRRFQKIGEWPGMKVEEARHLARTILALADRGTDPWEGLEERLLEDIKRQGLKWKADK